MCNCRVANGGRRDYRAAMAAPSIERTILLDDLAMSSDEVWRLIGTAEGWREWLVDRADYIVVESTYGDRDHETQDIEAAIGEVVDDGVRRAVRIGHVRSGEHLTFVWSSDEGDLSEVTLRLDETADGRRVLRITEAPMATCVECPLRDDARTSRWALRECLLCLTARATSRV